MSKPDRIVIAAVLLVLGSTGAVTPAVAVADLGEFAINGTFTAISDGDWAKTNERRHKQQTVVSTWTITTSCWTAGDCAGQMTSDHGWTADVTYTEPMWYVTRTLDDWLTCPDGSTAPGQQTYKFFEDQFDKPNIRGWDNTLAPSGACGVNKAVNIELPFKLIPVG